MEEYNELVKELIAQLDKSIKLSQEAVAKLQEAMRDYHLIRK